MSTASVSQFLNRSAACFFSVGMLRGNSSFDSLRDHNSSFDKLGRDKSKERGNRERCTYHIRPHIGNALSHPIQSVQRSSYIVELDVRR